MNIKDYTFDSNFDIIEFFSRKVHVDAVLVTSEGCKLDREKNYLHKLDQ
jgi:hypothetical protein